MYAENICMDIITMRVRIKDTMVPIAYFKILRPFLTRTEISVGTLKKKFTSKI